MCGLFIPKIFVKTAMRISNELCPIIIIIIKACYLIDIIINYEFYLVSGQGLTEAWYLIQYINAIFYHVGKKSYFKFMQRSSRV